MDRFILWAVLDMWVGRFGSCHWPFWTYQKFMGRFGRAVLVHGPFWYRPPQGSGLGPTKFIAYPDDTISIFPTHHIQYHLFADDTQMYDHCSVSNVPDLVSRLSACIDDRQVLCVSSSPTEPFEDRIYLVRYSIYPLQNTTAIPLTHCMQQFCTLL